MQRASVLILNRADSEFQKGPDLPLSKDSDLNHSVFVISNTHFDFRGRPECDPGLIVFQIGSVN